MPYNVEGLMHATNLPLYISEDNVSSTPTDAELNTAFGDSSGVTDGFLGILDDAGAGSAVFLVVQVNNGWFMEGLTKAT